MKTILLLILTFSSISFGGASPLFREDIEGALKEAKQSKKPLIIDFYGIWCPPCNQLDETVFGTPTFVQKAERFVLLKVDADAEKGWAIKSKYKIGGYPTILFTDSNGEEIYRIVGYRGPVEFFRVMDMVYGAKGKALSKACKSVLTDDLWRCILISRERKDDKTAKQALLKFEKKVKKDSAQYLLARTYAVELAETDDLKRAGYEKLITEYPATPTAFGWSMEYLALFGAGNPEKPKIDLIEKVVANYPEAMISPMAGELGYPLTDLAQFRAELLARIGKPDQAKAAWREAAQLLEGLNKTLPKDVSHRGFTLERISCLESAGDFEGAFKLAQEYRGQYPKEFTFHYIAAGMLQRAKKYNEALPVAKEAFEHSYGDNRIRAAILLVNLYATVPNKAAAKEVVDKVNNEIRPKDNLEVRTHRYLRALDDAWAKVEKLS